MPPDTEHIYEPRLLRVTGLAEETPTTTTFQLAFEDGPRPDFKCGQFGEFGLYGAGEATFCLASPPHWEGLEITVKEVGKVTRALHNLNEGDQITFRGPYGNWFPYEELKGKKLLFIGGGIGQAPLRGLLWTCLENRGDFEQLDLIYAAREECELVYERELVDFEGRDDMGVTLALDPVCPGEPIPGWRGRTSFVPPILEEERPSPENRVVITCGPPIMIKLVAKTLIETLGYDPAQIWTTLEMRMKCGLGKCGRCNIGSTYVCKDGPVFTYEQVLAFPQEF
ncbi:MAG: FAD/NAD(P)-binding protein [Candidatus Coatesbacteria bacterium]|nr:MAG: FAD/NAD(P)-binding protein [Candidatus Coatesbacteria bacterium]